MTLKKRNVILTIFVLSMFIMQSITLASAIYIPPPDDGDPPITYRVYGYVKDIYTETGISSALVKIYTDTGNYLGSVSSSSSGYFSKYVTCNPPDFFKIVVTKSGYSTSTNYKGPVGTKANFGNVMMTPTTPPSIDPIIGTPSSSCSSPISVTITASVTWHYDPYYSRSVYVEIGSESFIMQPIGGDQYTKTFSGADFRSSIIYNIKAIEKWYDGEPPILKTVTATSSNYQTCTNPWFFEKSQLIRGYPGIGINYQLRYVAHHGFGEDSGEHVFLPECRSDFADIRFGIDDRSVLFDYWCEEYVLGDYAIFWVEVGVNLDADVRVRLYWGNPEATSTSDGSSTFLFFDDFQGTYLDQSKWDNVQGSASVSDGNLRLLDDTYGVIVSSDWYDGGINYSLESSIYRYDGHSAFILRDQDYASFPFSKGYAIMYGTENTLLQEVTGAGYIPLDEKSPIPYDAWTRIQIAAIGDRYACFSSDVRCEDDTYQSGHIAIAKLYNGRILVDWIFVRSLVENQPIHGPWSFVNDHFHNPSLNSAWDVIEVGNPSWDYDIVDYSADNQEGTNLDFNVEWGNMFYSDWRGYYFDQDNLDVSNGYHFELKVGWCLYTQNGPAMKFGMQLFSGSSVVSEIYYEDFGHWDGRARIFGSGGGSSEYVWDPPAILCPHDYLFELDQDPLTSKVTYSYYDEYYHGSYGSKHTLDYGFDNSEVDKVRLFVLTKADEVSENFHVWFDFIKDSKQMALKRPIEDLSPFDEPIQNPSFETTPNPSTNWHDGNNQMPAGVLETDIFRHGEASWYSGTSSGHDWKIVQDLKESYSIFNYSSIWNQYVGFTCKARPAVTHSMVRAVLRYREFWSNDIFSVCGDWVELKSTSTDWNIISVSTPYRLGAIEWLEVRIEGYGCCGDDFSAYVDNTQLYLFEHDLLDSSTICDNPFDYICGKVGTGLSILKAESDGDNYEIDIVPMVLAEAFNGYHIDAIKFDIEVDADSYHPDNEAEIMDIAVANNGASPYLGTRVEQWMIAEMVIGNMLKWGTRIFILGTGLNPFVAWGLSEFVSYVATPCALSLWTKDTDHITAGMGDSAYCDWKFTDSSTTTAVASLNIEWRYPFTAGPTNPTFKVTFTIEWAAAGYSTPTHITRHSMFVGFMNQ